MRKGIRHIWWLCCGIIMMALAACYNDNHVVEQEPTMLTVYVYSPEHPMLTRADVGRIEASPAERAIKSLKIWVFNVNTGEKVCDYTLAENEITMLNSSENGRYQIPVSDDFARKKPDVDVFVAANVPEDIYHIETREELLNATVTGFGLSEKTMVVPGTGLPMSGMLRSQPVVGDAPVLRIGTERELAVVPLVRAVSKLRFVFATTGPADLKITGITLQADKIPTTEYLFRQDKPVTYLEADAAPLFVGNKSVAKSDDPDPTAFIYAGQTAQEYESLINDGINQSKLTEIGPYYLRESDRKLEGQIKYIIGNGAEQTGSFSMERAGDFLRNHSWIVYAYHTGGQFLELNTIYVKTWTTKEVNHEVYNW